MSTEKTVYKPNWTVNHDGCDYTPESTKDEPLRLTEKEAKPLLASGVISLPDTPSESAKGSSNTKEGSNAEQAAIIKAISKLNTEDKTQFNNDGKPNVKALEEILGKPITATERDEAWVFFSELTSQDNA